jgi:hypothetical protein
MLIAGGGVFLIWLGDFIGRLLAGQAPEQLGLYATMYTHAFDIAIISPVAVLTCIYLLRRAPVGAQLGRPYSSCAHWWAGW